MLWTLKGSVEAAKRGELPVIKIGRKLFVPISGAAVRGD
jgi:hypothetical protein